MKTLLESGSMLSPEIFVPVSVADRAFATSKLMWKNDLSKDE